MATNAQLPQQRSDVVMMHAAALLRSKQAPANATTLGTYAK
jgi:hypothetical protein